MVTGKTGRANEEDKSREESQEREGELNSGKKKIVSKEGMNAGKELEYSIIDHVTELRY